MPVGLFFPPPITPISFILILRRFANLTCHCSRRALRCTSIRVFFNNYMPILRDHIIYLSLLEQALKHSYINNAGWFILSSAYNTYFLYTHIEKIRQFNLPLFKEGTAV